MKLSWKIVLVVLLIVAVTVSAASYTMIASAFQAELDSQVLSLIHISEPTRH